MREEKDRLQNADAFAATAGPRIVAIVSSFCGCRTGCESRWSPSKSLRQIFVFVLIYTLDSTNLS
jgi:hypothetical protein